MDGKTGNKSKEHDKLTEDWKNVPKAVYMCTSPSLGSDGHILGPEFIRFPSLTVRDKTLHHITVHKDVVGDTERVILEDLINIDKCNDIL